MSSDEKHPHSNLSARRRTADIKGPRGFHAESPADSATRTDVRRGRIGREAEKHRTITYDEVGPGSVPGAAGRRLAPC